MRDDSADHNRAERYEKLARDLQKLLEEFDWKSKRNEKDAQRWRAVRNLLKVWPEEGLWCMPFDFDHPADTADEAADRLIAEQATVKGTTTYGSALGAEPGL